VSPRLLCRWARQFDIEKYAPTAGHYRCTCETVFWLPELLRWLVTHGRVEEAEATSRASLASLL